MTLLNSGKLKKGNMIVFDEAGVGLPAREWYTISNKAINYIFQTFRRENLGVIFTTPNFDFIDSQTRKLFHNYIETISINRKEEYVVVKFMDIQFSPRYGKVYFKYPRIYDKTKGFFIIDRVEIAKPSTKLVEAYEEKKKRFTRILSREVEFDIKIAEARKERKRISPEEIVEKILSDQKNMLG
jgi:hypothetical protein